MKELFSISDLEDFSGRLEEGAARQIRRLSRETRDLDPLPRHRSDQRMRLVCNECSKKFRSDDALPTCPGCGGSDVELR